MTPDQIDEFFSFLYEGTFGEITFWLRLAAGVFTSALLGAIAVVAIKYRELYSGRGRPAPRPARSKEVVGAWEEAKRRIESTSPADWNLAVIRADAALDSALKDMGFAEGTLGERLAKLDREKFRSLDRVWEAHKLRNRIAHETDFTLAHDEARRAMAVFANALEEFGYLPNGSGLIERGADGK